MRASKRKSILSPKVVGTIHSEGSLRRALRLKAGEIDLLELRVDHFAEEPALLLKSIPKLAVPLIVTVAKGTALPSELVTFPFIVLFCAMSNTAGKKNKASNKIFFMQFNFLLERLTRRQQDA